ncbi:unnamed protein product [Phytomonas sp. EM1]|nr:unnamed protein product [Phytomonas sp. EM1]|eukprot:CCW64631.1 unnamed protein product [Phytomonas sp. isolate EM1]
MLQFEWPKVWSLESRESVRAAIESIIRSAMSGSTNSKIRGMVVADLPSMGLYPPELMLSGIREVSPERIALMVKLRYDGDFSVTLRGLEINLDTIGSNDEEANTNLAMPFYCPFEMTLQDIRLDGMASIDLFQELEDMTRRDSEDTFSTISRTKLRPMNQVRTQNLSSTGIANLQMINTGSSDKLLLNTRAPALHTSGYGVLFGAGGRRAMRPPEVIASADIAPKSKKPWDTNRLRASSAARSFSSDLSQASNVPDEGVPSGRRYSMLDLLTNNVTVKQRVLRIQLFGDPLKSFKVVSNFATVPGVNNKVDAIIKTLIKPSIERMMTEGISINL